MSLIHAEHDRAKPAQYRRDATMIDNAGPFCWAEPCVGGIRLHFQRLNVEIDGHYTLVERGASPLHTGVDNDSEKG